MKLACLLLSFALPLSGAGKNIPALAPRTRIVLDKLIQEPESLMGDPRHDIAALSFSPDGARLAVVVGQHRHEALTLLHFLVVGLDHVERVLWQLDLPSKFGFVDSLRWSDDGHLLFLQFPDRVLLVGAQTGLKVCESPGYGGGRRSAFNVPGGFIGSNLYVVGRSGDVLKKDGWLRFYDLSCRLVMQGPAQACPLSGDTAPVAGLFAMADSENRIVALQPDGQERFSIQDSRVHLRVAFLNSGRMLCSGKLPGPDDGSLRCWVLDTPSPTLFRHYEVHNGGTAPFVVSSAGSIAMIAESGFSYNPLTENIRSPLKRYVIWDVTSGRTLGAISPRKQWRQAIGERFPRKLVDSLVFAVSGSGALVAIVDREFIEIFDVPKPD